MVDRVISIYYCISAIFRGFECEQHVDRGDLFHCVAHRARSVNLLGVHAMWQREDRERSERTTERTERNRRYAKSQVSLFDIFIIPDY